jgi:antirestriction protein ArdC
VAFYKQHQVADQAKDTGQQEPGEGRTKTVPVLRYFRVFNAEQAGNLPQKFHPEPGTFAQLTEPQVVLDGYLRRGGPQLRHVAGDRADYHWRTDTIRLPLPGQFCTREGYYATAFHECGHSTGHASRLARPGIVGFDHYGSQRYAKEELVAQMASSILCAHTGIDTAEEFANSASYISSWLRALHADKKLVVSAAAHAQRASDLVIQPSREPEPVRESEPEQQTKPGTAMPTAAPSHHPPPVSEPEAEAG